MLHITPQTSTLLPLHNLKNSFSLVQSPSITPLGQTFSSLADALESVIGSVLYNEKLTLNHLQHSLNSHSATSSEKENGLHPTYVMSLQEAMEFDMEEFVKQKISAIDFASIQRERKCARLMTLLKPAYAKADKQLPTLSYNSVDRDDDSRPSFEHPTLENANLLILLARRKESTSEDFFCYLSESEDVGVDSDSRPTTALNSYFWGLVCELAKVLSHLESVCDEKACLQLMHKEQIDEGKKCVVENFRLELVRRLFDCHNLRSDTLIHIARIGESVLFDGACIYEGRRGIFYLTARYMTFHASGVILLLEPLTHVFPIASIEAIGVLLVNSSGNKLSVIDGSQLGTEILSITMGSDPPRSLMFTLPGATPDHVRRLADLIGCLRTLVTRPAVVDHPVAYFPATTETLPLPSLATPAAKVDRIKQKLASMRASSMKTSTN